jgi:hypothetical protein
VGLRKPANDAECPPRAYRRRGRRVEANQALTSAASTICSSLTGHRWLRTRRWWGQVRCPVMTASVAKPVVPPAMLDAVGRDEDQHSPERPPRRAPCSRCSTGWPLPRRLPKRQPYPSWRASGDPLRALVGQRLGSSRAFRCCAALARTAPASLNSPICRHFVSGANRDRTGDLLLAKRPGRPAIWPDFPAFMRVCGPCAATRIRRDQARLGWLWAAESDCRPNDRGSHGRTTPACAFGQHPRIRRPRRGRPHAPRRPARGAEDLADADQAGIDLNALPIWGQRFN